MYVDKDIEAVSQPVLLSLVKFLTLSENQNWALDALRPFRSKLKILFDILITHLLDIV